MPKMTEKQKMQQKIERAMDDARDEAKKGGLKTAKPRTANRKQRTGLSASECQSCEQSSMKVSLELFNGELLCKRCIAAIEEKTKLHREIAELKSDQEHLKGCILMMSRDILDVYSALEVHEEAKKPSQIREVIFDKIEILKKVARKAVGLAVFEVRNSNNGRILRDMAIRASSLIPGINPE